MGPSRNVCHVLRACSQVVTGFPSVSRLMRAFAASIVETVRHPLLVLDAGLRVRAANPAFYTRFRVPTDQSESQAVFTLGDGFDLTDLRERLKQVATTGEMFEGFEVQHDFPGTRPKTFLLNARRIVSEDERSPMILLAIEDVTEKKEAEDALRRLNRTDSPGPRPHPGLLRPRWRCCTSGTRGGSTPHRPSCPRPAG